MADNSKIYKLTIYTPNDAFLDCDAKMTTVPSVQGSFQVLVNHAPIIAAIDSGIVKIITADDKETQVKVERGFAELRNNHLTITVSTAQYLNEEQAA
jgi:F-type H+-transporting ATPase subunit epsilon